MLSVFSLYFKIGVFHIADISAFDHIVFLVALTASFKPTQWKSLFVLISAFTIGHSFTLVLATFKILLFPSEIIEFLIPVTILLTSIYSIFTLPKDTVTNQKNKLLLRTHYALALFFGFIHGLGFSGYLQHLLGKSASISLPLFAFNVGIEIGQILIISVLFGFYLMFNILLKTKHRDWTLVMSGIAAGISIILITQTAFW